ncbi:MAG: class I SAM-dependent methyltransferase [Candidatus Binatia bacterium]|nr:class I SAM-dependent methyltransferase [Candidatus Binatia bacterium]
MVGGLAGRTVLDLACGTGFYTRRLKERGASSVLGVDLSREVIEVARRHEGENPVGVSYRVADA